MGTYWPRFCRECAGWWPRPENCQPAHCARSAPQAPVGTKHKRHVHTLVSPLGCCTGRCVPIGSHYAGSQRYVLMPSSSLGHYAGSQRYVLMPGSPLGHYAAS